MSNTKSTINKLPARNKARLTYNIIEHVLAYINIGHIDNIIEALGVHMNEGVKEKLKYIREDIRLVFNDLINNTKELLNVMYILKVILSGSRSSNFFKSGYNSRVFDYNFYTKDNIYYIVIFMTYMKSISVY